MEIVKNNLARLFFTLRNKDSLAKLFSEAILEVILDNEKVIFFGNTFEVILFYNLTKKT